MCGAPLTCGRSLRPWQRTSYFFHSVLGHFVSSSSFFHSWEFHSFGSEDPAGLALVFMVCIFVKVLFEGRPWSLWLLDSYVFPFTRSLESLRGPFGSWISLSRFSGSLKLLGRPFSRPEGPWTLWVSGVLGSTLALGSFTLSSSTPSVFVLIPSGHGT